ncbi:Ionotropic receptor 880 [Blattella germanica]|nr:Ionotropic receptor 880 [Blattella germanica]
MRIYSTLIHLLCFYLTSVFSQLFEFLESNLIRGPTQISDFLESPMFSFISKDHFSSTKILSIVIETNYEENWRYFSNKIVEKLLGQIGIPQLIISMKQYMDGNSDAEDGNAARKKIINYPAESQHSYLIIAHDALNLNEYLSSNQNPEKKFWNPKDNFTIVLTLLSKSDCLNLDFSQSLLDNLWQSSKIINVILIVKYFIECDDYEDAVFIFNPFSNNGNNGYGRLITINAELDHIPKTYLELTWNLNKYPLRVSLFNVFPTAQRKCNNCPFVCNFDKASYVSPEAKNYVCNDNYEGRDWEVLKNLATYMNFTVRIVPEAYTGDISETLSNLKNKVSDVAFNEHYMKLYNGSDIEFTMPAFYTRQIVVLVPKAQVLPIWNVMCMYFSGYFWIYFAITFLSSCFFWYFLRRRQQNVSQLINALDMLAIFLTMSVNFITKIAISSQRILLSCCLFFSLIVMCCFQSSLLDVVTHPHFKPDINTLKQLDEAEIPIFTLDPSLIDTFENSESIYMKNLNARVMYQKNLTEDLILQEIIINKNCSLLTSMTEAYWYLGKYPNHLHIVKEYPREYFVSYIIPRGSPYATRIHNLLGKMSQAGLVTKWDEDSNYILKQQALRKGINYRTTTSDIFVLYNLLFCFLVFGAGIVAGVLVFIVELSTWLDISVRIRNPNDSKIGKIYMVK